MVKIACVVDEEDVRNRLAGVLQCESNKWVEFTMTDRAGLPRALDELCPDVVCVKRIPLREWFSLLHEVEDRCTCSKRPRLVLLAHQVDSAYVYRVLSYGFDDVVDIGMNDEAVLAALEAASDPKRQACEQWLVGGIDLPPSLVDSPIAYADQLDYRIAGMIAAGYTDREISEAIHFSYQAVRNRVSALLCRSGLHNRTHLASRYTIDRLREI